MITENNTDNNRTTIVLNFYTKNNISNFVNYNAMIWQTYDYINSKSTNELMSSSIENATIPITNLELYDSIENLLTSNFSNEFKINLNSTLVFNESTSSFINFTIIIDLSLTSLSNNQKITENTSFGNIFYSKNEKMSSSIENVSYPIKNLEVYDSIKNLSTSNLSNQLQINSNSTYLQGNYFFIFSII